MNSNQEPIEIGSEKFKKVLDRFIGLIDPNLSGLQKEKVIHGTNFYCLQYQKYLSQVKINPDLTDIAIAFYEHLDEVIEECKNTYDNFMDVPCKKIVLLVAKWQYQLMNQKLN